MRVFRGIRNIYNRYSNGFFRLLTVAVIGFTVYSLFSLNSNTERLSKENKDLNQQNVTLGKQSQKIAEENQAIAKQNRAYSRCIAEIFAKFTQDNVPIIIENLDACQIGNQNDDKSNTPPQQTTTTPPDNQAPNNPAINPSN